MRASLIRGEVTHERHAPAHHYFQYPHLATIIPLTSPLPRVPLLFEIDRWGLLSLFTKDYLLESGELSREVVSILTAEGIDTLPARISMISIPRMCGYVFNPVTFFPCWNTEGVMYAVVIEVHNTFGEAHIYCATPAPQPHSSYQFYSTFPKKFYVSPFMNTSGTYEVGLTITDAQVAIRVALHEDGAEKFWATLEGTRVPLTARSVAGSLLRFPLSILLTMIRIHWQALRLYRGRKAPLFSPDTSPPPMRARVGPIHRLRHALVRALMRGK